jgi:hypothetical protein
VIGAVLPAAAAAERMVLAWDQCASAFANSPEADTIEKRMATLGISDNQAMTTYRRQQGTNK